MFLQYYKLYISAFKSSTNWSENEGEDIPATTKLKFCWTRNVPLNIIKHEAK